MTETIFALATARGKAGVAVIRVSGPQVAAVLEAFGLRGVLPRRATLRNLVHGGEVLDQALVLLFEPGASFTGEAVVELHLHGSTAVVQGVTQVLIGLPGLRPAEAGEFTRRALENGVLDLTQVEGLADLIDAETVAQRRQAQRVLSGEIGKRAELWRKDLIRAAALIEATIDFADEDVPQDVTPEVAEIIAALLAEFRRQVDGSHVAERIREGFEVAIIGAPNAGKSSLLNHLAGREAAITSPIAGTTRDVIEVRLDLSGIPVTLLDTAGLRETSDEVEAIGVDRARNRAAGADLRVLLLAPEESSEAYPLGAEDILVRTKADLTGDSDAISVKTGQGIDTLIARIVAVLSKRSSGSGVLVRERHRVAMLSAIRAMESAQRGLYDPRNVLELVAADLRSAISALEMLVGRIGVETLLDEIFASFCIGK